MEPKDNWKVTESHPTDLHPPLISAAEKNMQHLRAPNPDRETRNEASDKKGLSTHVLQLPAWEILQNTNAGTFVSDENNKVIWLNDSLVHYAFTGEDIKIIIGKDASHALRFFKEFLITPQTLFEEVKELINDKKTYLGIEIPCKNGKIIILDYIPIFHEGTFRGTVWQVRDFTKKMTREPDSLAYADNDYLEMLKSLHILFCKIDMNGTIIDFPGIFEKFTGYARNQLIHTNIADLCLSGDEQAIFRKNLKSGLTQKDESIFESEIITRNGSKKWAHIHVSRLLPITGDFNEAILIISDISEQKIIQGELEYARKLAESGQMAQQQFLANMSHEIRTPLNAIIGMSYLMEGTPLDIQQKEYIDILKNASNILLGLINDVLDFAKIEAGKQEVQHREFDLPGLIKAIAQIFTFKLQNKPIKLTYEIDPEIDHVLSGDDILLNQILMNLLGNAEKFTQKGEINIRVSVAREFKHNTWIEFSVSDTGIGISHEKIKEIFKDYIQESEDIRLQFGGSGLGLFICKKLIDTMGGEIGVESTPGKGSTFTFTLPFVQTDQPLLKIKDQIIPRYAFSLSDVRVLIVEDNSMNLKYLSSLLDKVNISFEVATDGKQALEITQKNYFNLILMDIKLPQMSGIEVASSIRETDNPNIATPIVLVTAAAFRSTVEKAKEAGVNELITKPYTPNQLISVLKKYLITDEEDELLKEEPDNESGFQFDKKLDTDYLKKLYSGDKEYAINLFQVFLECMDEDWQDLQATIKEENWPRLKGLVHKIKPNFSMVGLTWVTQMMQTAYENLQNGQQKEATNKLNQVEKEFERNLPLVKKELRRMKRYLKKELSSSASTG